MWASHAAQCMRHMVISPIGAGNFPIICPCMQNSIYGVVSEGIYGEDKEEIAENEPYLVLLISLKPGDKGERPLEEIPP